MYRKSKQSYVMSRSSFFQRHFYRCQIFQFPVGYFLWIAYQKVLKNRFSTHISKFWRLFSSDYEALLSTSQKCSLSFSLSARGKSILNLLLLTELFAFPDMINYAFSYLLNILGHSHYSIFRITRFLNFILPEVKLLILQKGQKLQKLSGCNLNKQQCTFLSQCKPVTARNIGI